MINYPGVYQPQYQQMQQTNQIQNGGFIGVRSIEEARNYPIAPGNAVTFKIDNQPIVCEKLQGFSQFEAPKFKVYKLVEEDYKQQPMENVDYVLKSDLEAINERIEALEARFKETTDDE